MEGKGLGKWLCERKVRQTEWKWVMGIGKLKMGNK